MSNIHNKRWQALRLAVDCMDLVWATNKDDIIVNEESFKDFRKTLIDMQEDALLQKRSSEGLDGQALDVGIAKRDFIQNYGEIPTQIALYQLLAESAQLVFEINQGTMVDAITGQLKQLKLGRRLDMLVSDTEKTSGRSFQHK